MDSIRQKLKRTLSIHDKNPEFEEHDDADDETTGNLHREINESEEGNHYQGKPGSFLNRLISYGNKKTEDEIARDSASQ